MENSDIESGREVRKKDGTVIAPHVTQIVAGYLRDHNPLVKGYMTLNEQMARAELDGDLGDIKLVIHDARMRPAGANHERNWTAPSDDHGLSACVVLNGGDDLQGYGEYPLVVRAREDHGKLSYLDRGSPFRDPMKFVLSHPEGNSGYSRNLRKADPGAKYSRISPTMYAVYHMHDRKPAANELESSRDVEGVPRRFSTLLEARKLFGEQLIDQYLNMQDDRLNWMQLNQKTIRAETYEAVKDAVLRDTGAAVGRRVILAPSFIGGPRHYASCFRDAMAIVRKHGRPDLFITMTCNPKWCVSSVCVYCLLPSRARAHTHTHTTHTHTHTHTQAGDYP